jgi:PAS domain S-box-containing protein
VDTGQREWLEQVGSVLETLNQGVIINDEMRRVVYANSTFQEMIQKDAAQLMGRTMVDFYPPEDVARLLELIGRRETHGRARYEFYIPQADGGRLPVAVTSRQVQGADGALFGIVTATDISEQKLAEEELRKANEQLLARQRQMEEELLLAERVQQSLAPKSLSWGVDHWRRLWAGDPAKGTSGRAGLRRVRAWHQLGAGGQPDLF